MFNHFLSKFDLEKLLKYDKETNKNIEAIVENSTGDLKTRVEVVENNIDNMESNIDNITTRIETDENSISKNTDDIESLNTDFEHLDDTVENITLDVDTIKNNLNPISTIIGKTWQFDDGSSTHRGMKLTFTGSARGFIFISGNTVANNRTTAIYTFSGESISAWINPLIVDSNTTFTVSSSANTISISSSVSGDCYATILMTRANINNFTISEI